MEEEEEQEERGGGGGHKLAGEPREREREHHDDTWDTDCVAGGGINWRYIVLRAGGGAGGGLPLTHIILTN